MKIYEIGTGYTPIPAQMGAATEIVVEELTRSLLKKGVDAEIIDIKAKNRGQTELPITEVSVPSVFTKADVSLGIMHKLKRVCYSVALARKLKKLLKKTDEKAVLHFHNQYNAYFFFKLTSKKLREKAIVAYTVHSYIWGTQWNEIENTVKKKYFQEIYSVRNADAVFVLNDVTVEHFVTRLGVDKNRIFKTINGVNVERYSPLTKERVADFEKSLGLEGKKLIFQVGSVCDRKNQLGTLEMLSDYLKSNGDVVFGYAGGVIDFEYQKKINELAEQNGVSEQVKYFGELSPGEELNKYYNIAECSVFSSTLESFGLVIIEAISAGTPVVMSNNLMFELSKGYYTYNSPDELVNIIDEILEKGKTEFADRSEVVEKYGWDAVAEDYLSKIKNI